MNAIKNQIIRYFVKNDFFSSNLAFQGIDCDLCLKKKKECWVVWGCRGAGN